jgi:hypothetical protein
MRLFQTGFELTGAMTLLSVMALLLSVMTLLSEGDSSSAISSLSQLS